MMVLGVHDSHDASACLLIDGKIVAAAMEERFQRVKNVATFPLESVRYCLDQAGLQASDVDLLAFATEKVVPTNLHSLAGSLSIAQYFDLHEKYFVPITYEQKQIRLADVFPGFKPDGTMHYPLDRVPFASSGELTRQELTDLQNVRTEFAAERLGIDPGKIARYDHHDCHGFHAYFSAPERRPNVAVVTSDGGGDAIYESVTHVVDGKFNHVHRGRTSLIGKIYSTVTLLLRMHPHRHAYKVMGLAPYASEHHRKAPRQIFLDAIEVDGLGFKRNPDVKDFYKYFADRLRTFRFDAIAGGLQDFVEIRLEEWFRNISERLGTRHFVFAGGVANNTKANLRLLNQPFVQSLRKDGSCRELSECRQSAGCWSWAGRRRSRHCTARQRPSSARRVRIRWHPEPRRGCRDSQCGTRGGRVPRSHGVRCPLLRVPVARV
jgi:carbamoyltransferase